ncbi:Demethylmenaquinone methyltransferase [Corynebacterium kalinowskii]|uniref:Demethylmenaquinone methyltransferase n=2 Tax=Corynebacterium kalinowskii TaxID=2675216 RepID=A0A6B8VQC1_9CORY|nr:Demethylmenaquinone methyltransferase [Corynebacterium kalinowskii]
MPEVTGIDLDQEVLEEARQHSDQVAWVHGDIMTYDFDRTFDVVASVATLHHLPDLDAALSRLADLTSPGGVFAVVGVARTSRPKDMMLHLAGVVQHRWMAVRKESRIEALYRSSGEKKSRWFVADPYGLVHKGRSWYLVADIDGAPRMLVASRLESFRVLSQPAQLRAGQTLASVWAELVDLLESDTSVYVTAILRASRLDMAQRILCSRLVQHDPVGRERVRIAVGYADIQGARQLLQFGDHIRVMDPPEAVDLIGMLASCLAERHGKGKR